MTLPTLVTCQLLSHGASTYFETDTPDGPDDPRRHGYSRDHRPDCPQVVIALVVTPEGFPLAYEVLSGNTADKGWEKDGDETGCHGKSDLWTWNSGSAFKELQMWDDPSFSGLTSDGKKVSPYQSRLLEKTTILLTPFPLSNFATRPKESGSSSLFTGPCGLEFLARRWRRDGGQPKPFFKPAHQSVFFAFHGATLCRFKIVVALQVQNSMDHITDHLRLPRGFELLRLLATNERADEQLAMKFGWIGVGKGDDIRRSFVPQEILIYSGHLFRPDQVNPEFVSVQPEFHLQKMTDNLADDRNSHRQLSLAIADDQQLHFDFAR